MPKATYRTTTVTGLRSGAQLDTLPAWYAEIAEQGSGVADCALQTAVEALEPCDTARVAYRDPDTDEWVEAPGHRALVNPEWHGDARDTAPQNTALWSVGTTRYDPVAPTDIFGPLVDALDDAGADADDATVFGQVREYRNGGEVHLDVFSTAFDVRLPVRDDPDDPRKAWYLGFQAGYDYFQQRTLYADVIAVDPDAQTVHRSLGERRSRRHYRGESTRGKTAREIGQWWIDGLDTFETVGEALFQVVADALRYEFDFRALPVGPADYLRAAELPDSLAEQAAERVGGASVETVSAFALHEALMKEITDTYTGKDDGTALRNHVQTANRLLFRPPKFEDNVLDSLTEQFGAQTTLAEHAPGADPGAAREAFEARRSSAVEAFDDYEPLRTRVSRLVREAAANDSNGASA